MRGPDTLYLATALREDLISKWNAILNSWVLIFAGAPPVHIAYQYDIRVIHITLIYPTIWDKTLKNAIKYDRNTSPLSNSPSLGYYGACNEEEMKAALVKGGPLVVGLEVYDDFLHYQGGIYHHTGLKDSFNPLEVR